MYICLICGKQNINEIGKHLVHSHKNIPHKLYYDIFLKCDLSEGICPVCNKPTKFLGITKGYRDHCSTRCSSLDQNVLALAKCTLYKLLQKILTKGAVKILYNTKIYNTYVEEFKIEHNCTPIYEINTTHASFIIRNYFDRLIFDELYGRYYIPNYLLVELDDFSIINDFTEYDILFNSNELNKNSYPKILCLICNKEISVNAFSMHLKLKHSMISLLYYDKYILENHDLKYCPICGKENKYYGILVGYSKHCSCKCAQVDENTKIIRDLTNKRLYGENYYDKFHQTFLNTFRSKYNVDNPGQVPEFRAKAENTSMYKYGVRCNFSSKDPLLNGEASRIHKYGSLLNFYAYVAEKAKLTNLEKYGVENVFLSNEIKAKIKLINLQKYDVEYPMQSKQIQEKAKQTTLENFGVEYPSLSKIVLDKQQQTCFEKYGVKCYLLTELCREALHLYSLDKFGTDCILLSDWFKLLMRDTYKSYSSDDWKNIAIKRSNTRSNIISMDGNHFDSSWEAKVYMFAKSNNYNIERIIPINYFDDNKQRVALIDFKINNRLVEIKGNHLLDGCYESLHIIGKLKLYRQNNVLVITSNIDKYINDEKFKDIEFMDINDLKEIK